MKNEKLPSDHAEEEAEATVTEPEDEAPQINLDSFMTKDVDIAADVFDMET